MFGDDVGTAISQLIEQWNIAERRIKKAEHIRGGEVVSSAIYELRYAGRKVVDSMQLMQTTAWREDKTSKAQILAYLADATEDCVKAKHDAIDAMMLFVTAWFDRVENKLGLSVVLQYFPNYIVLTGKIFDIQEMISESRGDRTQSRDGLYNEIEQSGYDDILSLYAAMKGSEGRVAAEVEKERQEAAAREEKERARDQVGADNLRAAKYGVWAAIGGVVVAIIGIVVGVLVAVSH